MVARDDSVIRGSLIACMIFLLISVALNFFLWRWGDTQAKTAEDSAARLNTVQTQVSEMENQALRMKAMLGVGSFTEAEIQEMKDNAAEDQDMQTIEATFARDMAYLGPDYEGERNYPALPEYLVNAIRSRTKQAADAEAEATKIRQDTDIEKQTALEKQQAAEADAKAAREKVADLTTEFKEDRERMNKEKEDTRDKLTATVQDFEKYRNQAIDDSNRLTQKTRQLQGTIDTQKLQLNELRADKFESTQGEIRYVVAGGNIVTINLGSADALRPGVTFGVIGGDETRLQDAKVKATIQITQVQGPHLAQARVVARPEIRNPIIPGDKIFSPFWAPGREVKIALAGDIDIDGDGRPDNDAIKGQIRAAGAVVAAEISTGGAITGKLDPSIRFMVVGEDPEISGSAAETERNAQVVAIMGNVKARAAELGLTIIPIWKLQAYLKTINDSLTTPLGSAVRAEDFPPETVLGPQRLPNDKADIYNEEPGIQRGNRVLSP